MIMTPPFQIIGVLLASVPLAACENHYKKVTAAKLAIIQPPPNLRDTPACQQAWNKIARFGMSMDAESDDWNVIVIDAAGELVENDCAEPEE